MQSIKKIKSFIQIIDFFRSNQYLKFKNNAEYKTFTGGLISLTLVVVILIAFSNMILETLRRDKIMYSLMTNLWSSPPSLTLAAGKQNNFMIGVNLRNVNLSIQTRTYDVTLQFSKVVDNVQTSQYIFLQPCTKQHWGTVVDSIWPKNQSLKITDSYKDPRQWLCVPVNKSLQIYGLYGSNFYQFMQVFVTICNSTRDKDYLFKSKCIFQLQENKKYILNNPVDLHVFYIDSVINPDDKNPIKYFINKSPLISAQYGRYIRVQVAMQDYQINTDNSLLPIDDIQTIRGGKFQQFQQVINVAQSPDKFILVFRVIKSRKSLVYNREVAKISAVFSYIGGLIGAILAVMFIFNSYTSFALEIALSSYLFKNPNFQQDHNKQKYIIKNTNIIQFLLLNFYKIYNKISKKSLKWPKYQYMQDYLNQIGTHLDVNTLMKRVILLQYYDNQFKILQEKIPTNFQHIRKNRLKICNINEQKKQQNKKQTFTSNKQQVQIVQKQINKKRQKDYQFTIFQPSTFISLYEKDKGQNQNVKKNSFENSILNNNSTIFTKVKHKRQKNIASKLNQIVLQSLVQKNQEIPVNFEIQSVKTKKSDCI